MRHRNDPCESTNNENVGDIYHNFLLGIEEFPCQV